MEQVGARPPLPCRPLPPPMPHRPCGAVPPPQWDPVACPVLHLCMCPSVAGLACTMGMIAQHVRGSAPQQQGVHHHCFGSVVDLVSIPTLASVLGQPSIACPVTELCQKEQSEDMHTLYPQPHLQVPAALASHIAYNPFRVYHIQLLRSSLLTKLFG